MENKRITTLFSINSIDFSHSLAFQQWSVKCQYTRELRLDNTIYAKRKFSIHHKKILSKAQSINYSNYDEIRLEFLLYFSCCKRYHIQLTSNSPLEIKPSMSLYKVLKIFKTFPKNLKSIMFHSQHQIISRDKHLRRLIKQFSSQRQLECLSFTEELPKITPVHYIPGPKPKKIVPYYQHIKYAKFLLCNSLKKIKYINIMNHFLNECPEKFFDHYADFLNGFKNLNSIELQDKLITSEKYLSNFNRLIKGLKDKINKLAISYNMYRLKGKIPRGGIEKFEFLTQIKPLKKSLYFSFEHSQKHWIFFLDLLKTLTKHDELHMHFLISIDYNNDKVDDYHNIIAKVQKELEQVTEPIKMLGLTFDEYWKNYLKLNFDNFIDLVTNFPCQEYRVDLNQYCIKYNKELVKTLCQSKAKVMQLSFILDKKYSKLPNFLTRNENLTKLILNPRWLLQYYGFMQEEILTLWNDAYMNFPNLKDFQFYSEDEEKESFLLELENYYDFFGQLNYLVISIPEFAYVWYYDIFRLVNFLNQSKNMISYKFNFRIQYPFSFWKQQVLPPSVKYTLDISNLKNVIIESKNNHIKEFKYY